MSDLVQRLREFEAFDDCDQHEINTLRAAADEIERQRNNIDNLRDRIADDEALEAMESCRYAIAASATTEDLWAHGAAIAALRERLK